MAKFFLRAVGMTMVGIVLDRGVSTWVAVVAILLWLVVEIVLRRKQIRVLCGRVRCYGAAHKMETILLCVVIGIVVGGLSGLGIGFSLTKPVPSKATTPVEQEEPQALPPSKVSEPEPKKQVVPTGDSPVKLSQKETTSPQKEPTNIIQTTHGPYSPAVVGDNAQVNITAPQPRTIYERDTAELVETLSQYTGQKVEISSQTGDGEQITFCEQLYELLRRSNWKPELGSKITIEREKVIGVSVRARDPNNPAAIALMKELEKKGFTTSQGVVRKDSLEPDMVEVMVGIRQ